MSESTNNMEKRQDTNLVKQALKAPIKFLAKARDLYVKSMMLFDGQMGRQYVAVAADVLPRTSNCSGLVDEEVYVKPVSRRSGTSRSLGVGVIERIDEDRVCEFGEKVMVGFEFMKLCKIT